MDKPHILIVEDNLDIISAMELLLLIEGIEATFCKTAKRAIESLSTSQLKPSLILVDKNLPDQDGCDLITKMRTDLSLKTPIYLFSADHIDNAKLAAHGATGLIRKPFDIDTLLNLAKAPQRP